MPGIIHNSNVKTSPVWAADGLGPDQLMRGPILLDKDAFLNEDGARVQLSAAAVEGAVAIVFDAITNPIPSGTVLDFGVGKYAQTTAAAAAGATGVAVEALPAALADNDVAIYAGAGTKKKRVIGGTYVGRTYAERETNDPFGPAATGDEERFLVAFDVIDLEMDASATAVRPKVVVKENFLPNYASMSSTIKGYLRADYTTQKGAA